MQITKPFRIVVQSLPGWGSVKDNLELLLAASRAGAYAVLNLEMTADLAEAGQSLEKLVSNARFDVGIKCGVDQLLRLDDMLQQFATCPGSSQKFVVLTAGVSGFESSELAESISWLSEHFTVWCEVVSLAEAKLAQSAGAQAVIVRGNEAGGRVGDQTSFVLLQECAGKLDVPLLIAGGIACHTASAAAVAGAAGVVLESQVLLTQESPLRPEQREKLKLFDGSEVQSLTPPGGKEQYRLLSRPGSGEFAALVADLDQLAAESSSLFTAEGNSDERGAVVATWRRKVQLAVLTSVLQSPVLEALTPLGQDVCLAAGLARQYPSVGSLIRALCAAVSRNTQSAASLKSLSAGSPLAVSHGTEFPILQGAMTRVSDNADFALSVAEGGALPFLALALMRAGEIEALLEEVTEKLEGKSWGVGILGFVPQALRNEQLEVVRKYKPPFALIAGGRPDQAAALDKLGINTYLHVPSPLLLESFIEMGSRRFIFEGRECGGHVGPRSSFVLWEQMIDVLLAAARREPQSASAYHVVFAGGIHDGLSAAMVAAMAAPLAQAGMKVGALLGTAYLFTQEAVTTGAIVAKFQQAALECTDTVLFETGPGHSIRCLRSPYKDTFDDTRRQMEKEGKGRNEIRQELELMNLGRLRIASKGLNRAESLQSQERSKLVDVPEAEQWQDGMYMIGQVAALRKETISIRRLHEQISVESNDYLSSFVTPSAESEEISSRQEEPIAIVGMSCLLPGAQDLESYWENILNKFDAIAEVPPHHWQVDNFYNADPLAQDKIYSRWGGFIKEIPFDPAVYGIPPASMSSIDPTQMLILEVVRAGLADAGYLGREFNKERASVVVANAGHGPMGSFYAIRSILDWQLHDMDPDYRKVIEKRLPEWTEDSFPGYLGNVIAGRVANRFDFGGINFCVDAACASSLAALYIGVRELRSGTSDMVLMAATDTHNQPGDYLSFSKTHALSPRGRCRTFDATADGIVISEGLAVLVLKRLSDAERDGDRIYAVVKGMGGSSDGRDLSLTAPRPAGQMLALERAYAEAGIDPSSVELVEAHGTGTVAGDRAEVEALTRVFKQHGADQQSCALGSVKTMIGHTKCTAGLASIIKVAKSLYHGVLPPTLGVETPNPTCKFEESPFYINSETRPWIHSDESPRRAGVSAFGFGGTNFHAVLEEYSQQNLPARSCAYVNFPTELFVIKATTREALSKSLESLAASARASAASLRLPAGPLKDSERQNLFNLALKSHLSGAAVREETALVRVAFVASSLEDLEKKVAIALAFAADSSTKRTFDPRGIYFVERQEHKSTKVAVLFPGQGAQQPNMLAQLSMAFREVKECFEKADRLLADDFEKPLSRFVYPEPAFAEDKAKEQSAQLTDTRIAQAAVATADMAAWALLQSFGLRPDCVAGHSFGEYVALAAAGSMTFAELLNVAERRGAILKEANGKCAGSMTAVNAQADQVRQLIASLSDVTLANINSPKQCIISGRVDALSQAAKVLQENKVNARPIAVSAAFHSPLMVPAQEQLAAALSEVSFKSPVVPVFSNTFAEPYPVDADRIAGILTEHLVSPVEFQKEIERMYESGVEIFVECGPGSILTNLVADILDGREHLAVSCDRAGRHGVTQLQHLLAQLVVAGVQVDAGKLYAGRTDSRMAPEMLPVKGSGKLTYLIDSANVQRYDRADLKTESKSGKTFPRLQYGVVMPPASATGATPSSTPAAAPRAATPAAQPQPTPQALSARKETAPPVVKAAIPAVPSTQPVAPRVQPPAVSANASVRDQVMIEFQRNLVAMTNNFMETQKRVMLAYLNGGIPDQQGLPAVAEYRPPAHVFVPSSITPATLPPAAQAVEHVPAVRLPELSATAIELQATAASSSVSAPAVEGLNAERLVASLIEIVSERTGYPADMLDPELDLEADLGIDSIKRVEILNSFRKLLPEARQAELESGIEKLAATKTLAGIIEWIKTDLAGAASLASHAAQDIQPLAVAASEPQTQAKAKLPNYVVSRGLVRLNEKEPARRIASIPSGWVLVTADGNGIAQAVTQQLQALGSECVVLRHADYLTENSSFITVDLKDAQAIKRTVDDLVAKKGVPHSFVHLVTGSGHAANATAMPVQSLFLLLKALEPHKNSSLRILAAVAGPGDFGSPTNRNEDLDPFIGGTAGIIKSVAREWTVCARVVDFGAIGSLPQRAAVVADELFASDNYIEVGYLNGKRLVPEVVPAAFELAEGNGHGHKKPDIDSSSIVLVTGGARGITAELVHSLAESCAGTYVIVGRAERPCAEESQATAAYTTPKDLKAAIMAQLKESGQTVSVPKVESIYQSLLKDREIRDNLKRIEQTGATVEYIAVDVLDRTAFSKVIRQIYSRFGKIDAVIHGAGIIEDAYIKDKSPESFNRVYSTKIDSARTMAESLDVGSLRYLIFLSSVVARTGNAGQSDYVAANETLNKLALLLKERTAGRVVSMMWGPWRGGMASADLEAVFASHGWAMIEAPEGRRSFIEELAHGSTGDVEVLLVGQPCSVNGNGNGKGKVAAHLAPAGSH